MTQGLGIDPAGIWAVFIMVQCAFRPQRNVYIPLNTQSPEKTKCWETDMDTLLYVKQITNKSYCTAQGTLLNVMWQPGWEGSLGKNGCLYMYG